jgi:tRNA pseudouridine55 synthase
MTRINDQKSVSDSKDGIILLAKQSGITSFSSLWQIKNALSTKKIGHTGTLDTFAEGLLVAVSGRLTRLAPYITDCDKEYEALIRFGVETDTLDPDGAVVSEKRLPPYERVMEALGKFTGTVMQVPPSYSAVHVDGQRASDRTRKGESVIVPPRPVTIHTLEALYALDDRGNPASAGSAVRDLAIRVSCSKGTYIRSLARDIAHEVASCAHLAALRRTRIGPFYLRDAAGYAMLQPFGTFPPAKYGIGDKPPRVPESDILHSIHRLTPEFSRIIGLQPVSLLREKLFSFSNGKVPEPSWFSETSPGIKAVFCDGLFVGMVRMEQGQARYEFVLPQSIGGGDSQ